MDIKNLSVPLTSFGAALVFLIAAYVKADEVRDELVKQATAQQVTINLQTANIDKLIQVQESQQKDVENLKLQMLLMKHGISPTEIGDVVPAGASMEIERPE